MWRPEIRAGIDKYATNEKLYLLQNFIRSYTNSKKGIFKSKTWDALLNAQGDRKETIEVTKVLCVTGIAKGIVMAQIVITQRTDVC